MIGEKGIFRDKHEESHCENKGRDLHPTVPQTTSQSPEV